MSCGLCADVARTASVSRVFWSSSDALGQEHLARARFRDYVEVVFYSPPQKKKKKKKKLSGLNSSDDGNVNAKWLSGVITDAAVVNKKGTCFLFLNKLLSQKK